MQILCTKLGNILLLYSVLEKLGHPSLWEREGGNLLRIGAIWSRVANTTVELHCALRLPVLLFTESSFLVEERQKSRKTIFSNAQNRCLAVSTPVRILLTTLLLYRCVLLNGPFCILPVGMSKLSLSGAALPSISSFFSHLRKVQKQKGSFRNLKNPCSYQSGWQKIDSSPQCAGKIPPDSTCLLPSRFSFGYDISSLDVSGLVNNTGASVKIRSFVQLSWGNIGLNELAVVESLLNPPLTSMGMLKMLDSLFLFSPAFENPITLLARQAGKARANSTPASARNIFITLLGTATVPPQLVYPVTMVETPLVTSSLI